MATRTEWSGRLEVALLVAVGGFAGGSLRHVLGVLLPGLGGTLAANVLGCLALGFLVYEAELVGVANVTANYTLGFAAVLAGRALARRLADAETITEGSR